MPGLIGTIYAFCCKVQNLFNPSAIIVQYNFSVALCLFSCLYALMLYGLNELARDEVIKVLQDWEIAMASILDPKISSPFLSN